MDESHTIGIIIRFCNNATLNLVLSNDEFVKLLNMLSSNSFFFLRRDIKVTIINVANINLIEAENVPVFIKVTAEIVR